MGLIGTAQSAQGDFISIRLYSLSSVGYAHFHLIQSCLVAKRLAWLCSIVADVYDNVGMFHGAKFEEQQYGPTESFAGAN